MTARESAALTEQSAFLLPVSSEPLNLESVWGPRTPVVVEIGFGSGQATALMAAAAPHLGVLAVDVHTPGVGDLLDLIGRDGLTNIRVMEADALAVLEFMIPADSLAGLRTYFPDPWPKARHHKRRIVQPDVLGLVVSRLRPTGFWHIATDWPAYAAAMQQHFDADNRWRGGAIDRPSDRPVTHYERRAVRDGRPVTDLWYERVPS